jgi:enhancing lycopene biosynthesis protein 2
MALRNSFVNNDFNAYFNKINATSLDNSTSTDSGSLIVNGGASIAKNIYIGGDLKCQNIECSNITYENIEYVVSTANSTSTDTGSLIVSGGMGLSKNLYVGGITNLINCIIQSTSDTTNLSTGSLVVSGGVSINKSLYIDGITKILNTTQSTSISTGSFIINGGVGIVKNITINGDENIYGLLTCGNTTQSTSTNTGSLIVNGGLGVGKNLFIGSQLNCTAPTDYMINLKNNASAGGPNTFTHCLASYKALMTGTENHVLEIGQSGTTNNACLLGFLYSNTGSSLNHMTFGMWGYNDIFQIFNTKIVSNMTTQSTDISTGSLITTGGCGIAKNLYVGGNTFLQSTVESINKTTGSVVVSGGIGITKNIIIGSNIISDTTKINREWQLLSSARSVGAAASTFSIINNYAFYGFSGSQNNELYASMDIPHDYRLGSDIIIHIHWFSASTSPGNVDWVLTYNIGINNGYFTTTGGTVAATVSVPVNTVTAEKHMYNEIATISGSTITANNAIINFKLQRLGNTDTYNDLVYLCSFSSHYQWGQIGDIF